MDFAPKMLVHNETRLDADIIDETGPESYYNSELSQSLTDPRFRDVFEIGSVILTPPHN